MSIRYLVDYFLSRIKTHEVSKLMIIRHAVLDIWHVAPYEKES